MSFLTHLECGLCGTEYDADCLWNLCPECSRPLLARYNLQVARQALTREEIGERAPTLWRYRELLPVREPRFVLCLGEGWTPLVHAGRLGLVVGLERLYIKDEGLNPTASFKARGLGVAMSRAHELGVESVSIPSAGNAAGALSAYAALAGIESHVF
ncbi:MAG: pyridoxal-phosphate dependent enzyme, partial [Anaerolineae bacterium]